MNDGYMVQTTSSYSEEVLMYAYTCQTPLEGSEHV